MHCDTLDCAVSDHMLTLSRPDNPNAFHGPMMNELPHAFNAADTADTGDLTQRHERRDRAVRPDGAAPRAHR